MYPGLALEQAPPLSVPLRFFLTAPLFGLLAGLLLALSPELLQARWSPAALALTHLLTLGVLAMVMCGALFQMLPVVAGSPVAAPEPTSAWVHLLLSLGSLGLALGLGLQQPPWMWLAGLLLAGAFGVFIGAIGRALWRAPRGRPSIQGMALALLALIPTLGLGLTLLLGHADAGTSLWREPLTTLHLGWGLLGWVGLLLIAVAYQVVPMFQLTPEYPRRLQRPLAPVLWLTLLGWSLARAWRFEAGAILAELLLGVGLLIFAILTLTLQHRRRRRLGDVTLDFWRLSMLSLIGMVGLYGLGRTGLIAGNAWTAALGVLGLVGFAMAAINGMIYKILPFLCWFHLQSAALSEAGRTPVPGMRSLLPADDARRQLRWFAVSLAVLLAATLGPGWLARLGGLLFAVSQTLLAVNLWSVVRRYRAARTRLLAGRA